MAFAPLWTCIQRSAKIGRLTDDLFRTWIMSLVAAQEYDRVEGALPPADDLAYTWHLTPEECASRLSRLVTLRLLDERDGIFYIHDWADWQYVKDPTAAKRKRDQREREKRKRLAGQDNTPEPPASPSTDVTPRHGDTPSRHEAVTPNKNNNKDKATAKEFKETTTPKPPSGEASSSRRGVSVLELKPVLPESVEEEAEPPDYPNPNFDPWMIHPGDHDHPEFEARVIFGQIWREWKSRKLCYEFYEHQRWVSIDGWKHAIKTAVKQNKSFGSIRYLETIGLDYDVNGDTSPRPVKRGELGDVPYKPTIAIPETVRQTDAEVRAKVEESNRKIREYRERQKHGH